MRHVKGRGFATFAPDSGNLSRSLSRFAAPCHPLIIFGLKLERFAEVSPRITGPENPRPETVLQMTLEELQKLNRRYKLHERFKAHRERYADAKNIARAFFAAECEVRAYNDVPCDVTSFRSGD